MNEAPYKPFTEVAISANALGVEGNHALLERGMRNFAPERDFGAAVTRLQGILTAAVAVIEERRTEKLRVRNYVL